MLILNFGHPLTGMQLEELTKLLEGQTLGEVKTVKVQVDMEKPFIDQAIALVDAVGWTGEGWQSNQFIIVPPGLASIALALVAEIHGRSGYFPTIVRMRPQGGTPLVFVPHELLDLARVREESRKKR